ncbi:tectonic [Drosophila bipectinata]|uniref:tectonic n=1 Tax=Drosophila bipectinata TaxID=42026 RepID=UPI0038B33EEC
MESRLLLALLGCLILPVLTIKIGISHDTNDTANPTRSTRLESLSTTPLPESNDAISSASPMPEIASSPSNSFPPRPQNRARTTSIPATRTTKASIAKTTEAPSSKPIPSHPPNYYCSCDIQAGKCNLNCCCDHDCNSEVRKVFSCLSSTTSPEVQAKLEDFQYNHGLPSCEINDGWLCVFRSNLKPNNVPPLILNLNAESQRKWPDLEAYDSNPIETRSSNLYYKFGEPLQLWGPENNELTTLELPISYESSQCKLKQAVRHLQSVSSHCRMKDSNELQESLWNIMNFTSFRQLLGKPRDPEEPEHDGITIQVCQKDVGGKVVCEKQGNETQLDVLPKALELQFVHNFTNILEAKLVITRASWTEDENDPIWLTYGATFISVNELIAKPTSGPLGYLPRSPLIVSKSVPLNSSGDQQVLSYFQDTNDFHWLPLLTRKPKSRICQRILNEEQALRFGVNLQKECQLSKAAPLLQETANHTEYCQEMQSEIWTMLLPHNVTHLDDIGQVYISQMGKPKPNKWLPIQLHYPGNVNEVPHVHGVYDDQQQSLSCRNIFLSVKYEFHVAEMTLLDGAATYQNVLHHASLVLGQRHDLEFDASEQQVELPLSISVMFYNMQKKVSINGAQLYVRNNFLPIVFIYWMINFI